MSVSIYNYQSFYGRSESSSPICPCGYLSLFIDGREQDLSRLAIKGCKRVMVLQSPDVFFSHLCLKRALHEAQNRNMKHYPFCDGRAPCFISALKLPQLSTVIITQRASLLEIEDGTSVCTFDTSRLFGAPRSQSDRESLSFIAREKKRYLRDLRILSTVPTDKNKRRLLELLRLTRSSCAGYMHLCQKEHLIYRSLAVEEGEEGFIKKLLIAIYC